ncbi:MAG: hypothetical protein J7K69_08440 [Thermotogae bacterium]|nr:hypothetical protein [Thermotogota bacterium]
MFSKRFCQSCLLEFIFLILIITNLFSYQLIYSNNGISGRIYNDIDELRKSVGEFNDALIGVFIKPDDVIDDVSFLCLGSSSKAFLAEELGFLIGVYLKKHGVNFCISGFPLVLSPNVETEVLDSKDFVSSSPYVTAQILELYYLGLIRSGIFPVIDASNGFDIDVISSLKTRGVYLPVLLREEQYEDFLRLKYDVPTLVRKNKGIFWNASIDISRYLYFEWNEEVDGWSMKAKELREKIVNSSIVLVKRGRFNKIKVVSSEEDLKGIDMDTGIILIDDPYLVNPKKVAGLVVIFSNDDVVINEAVEILKGSRVSTGKITWVF